MIAFYCFCFVMTLATIHASRLWSVDTVTSKRSEIQCLEKNIVIIITVHDYIHVAPVIFANYETDCTL